MKIAKRVMGMTMAAVMGLSLVACGGSTSGDTGSTGGSSGSGDGYQTDSLEVVIWDTNQQAGLQEIADEWSAESGVEAKVVVKDWDSYWTLLEAGATGGELPDVFWMHINEAQKYMSNDILLNLDDYIAADDTIDMANYYEGVVDIYNYEGTQYALPKDHDTIALLYNKEIFDKYGIDYPTNDWSWETYAQVAQQITEAGKDDGIYGTAMYTNDGQDGWYNLIYDYGGKLISNDKKTSGMDDPKTLEAMNFLADELIPYMPEHTTMAESDPDVLFQSGLIGMMLQGSWMVKSFYEQDNSDKFGWAEIPYYDANGDGECQKEERVSMYNGLGWAADANTADPKAAYDLMAAFASEEGQLKQAELGVTMAAYKGCSDSFVDAFEGMDITPFLSIEDDGTLIQHPASKNTTQWETMFTIDLVDAWKNPADMEKICKQMAEKMNEYLAEE